MGKVSRMSERNGDAGVEGEERPKAKRSRRSAPRDAPPQRSSVFRGVTRHRWTGRYEAHLWDKSSWNESQKKKGRQVYLGAYEDEEAAAHAYDLAALKYWGQDTILNFPPSTYLEELKEMEQQTKEEYIGSLRRKSSGFSRGVSKYRGVARHHHNGRWEARIGRVFGNKYLYLGTYATQEEAATAYDMAAIEYRGLNAVTNFDLSRYIKWLRPNPKSPCSASESTSKPNQTPEPGPIRSQGVELPGTHEEAQVGSIGSVSSALGLLLKSSKFREMVERTSSEESDSTPLTELDESSPLSDNQPRCSFPDDIQTYFECHELSSHSERDEILFGDLNSFMPMMFTEEELHG